MDKKPFTASISMLIHAPAARVWEALTQPRLIKQYLHDTDAISDWKEGSSLEFKGSWNGKEYLDKGFIQKIRKNELLQYSWLSSASGLPDKPENYSLITYRLEPDAEGTRLTLTQDNIASEEGQKGSEKNWAAVLKDMKALVEKGDA